jgi:hypothetical protein
MNIDAATRRLLVFSMAIIMMFFEACLWRSPRQGMQRKKLAEPEDIQGVLCAEGYAWMHKAGGLGSCALSEDGQVAGVDLPAGTTVFFNEDGEFDYCWLSRPTLIQGFECKGHGHSTMTGFYPSGRLKYFWPPENLVVDGVPCKTTGFQSVSLHENGRLRMCRLSEAATIQGRAFQAGEDIALDENGNLVESG